MSWVKLNVALVTLALAAGCGSENTETDAGPATDAAPMGIDASSETDAGAPGTDAGTAETDAGTPETDAGTPETDAGTPETDAGTPETDAGNTDAGATDAGFFTGDAGDACHVYDFGAPAVSIETPDGSPPTAIGGEIPEGFYDLVRVQSFGGTVTGGMARGTWVFQGGLLHTLTVLNLTGGELGEATPRTREWSTADTTLSSAQVCGGTTTFTNQYSVRMMAGGTAIGLQVINENVMFVFRKRR